MEMVNITINGQKISAPAGITILKAAQQAGIDIPTLCNHPALSPTGACRVCVVEVEGQRTLITACTFPITDGLVIQTESPQVVKARKFILDMLFSERNHFCMYCQMSGDCELQNLGYRYGIDHWVFPTYTKGFPVDATRKYFLMEHNRCVLCGRCERACGTLVANHTLGLRNRGAKSMIHADANLTFGDSSCVSCGTCLQVCPTGALCDKRSAFMGRDEQTQHVKTTCSHCSVGCAMEIVTRGGNVMKILGDWDGAVNGGVLCQHGRFDPLYDERTRITSPLIRQKGKLVPANWDEALQVVAKRLGKADAKSIGVLASSNVTNEALYLLDKLFSKEMKVANVGLLNRAAPRLFEKPQGSLADIEKSDVILVVGADPVKDQPVASFLVKRTVDRGGRLIVVDGEDNGLAPFAYMHLPMADTGKAVEIAGRANNPVILYGTGAPEKTVNALKKLQGKAAFVALEQGTNTRAAVAFGFANGFKPSAVKTLFLLLGEQDGIGVEALEGIGKGAFIVVQASFASPLTEQADVVLPMAIWSERSGSLTNTEGRVQKVSKAVEPEGEAKADWEIISLLAEKMDKKLGASLEELSARATQNIK
ncbi:MAG: 2Fe-2S iron-sulfur cluster binding domain-containing protein [Deltaproteobacteria bacterium]|nr:2Fe-2S iron-sulfur cluster binding domain-containing protein [Deltaproteobacteria bacterium]